jgi:hypothetical protein
MYKVISAEMFETILRSGVAVDFINIIGEDHDYFGDESLVLEKKNYTV